MNRSPVTGDKEMNHQIDRRGLRYEIQELENWVRLAKKAGRNPSDIQYVKGVIRAYKEEYQRARRVVKEVATL